MQVRTLGSEQMKGTLLSLEIIQQATKFLDNALIIIFSFSIKPSGWKMILSANSIHLNKSET